MQLMCSSSALTEGRSVSYVEGVLTIGAPVLPHAIPVPWPLLNGTHAGLPEEGVLQCHALRIAPARKPQEPAKG